MTFKSALRRAGDRASFSLLELLVTFSLIMVLVALLFPAFRAAREAARQAGCMSNLHQIGIAINMYGQDKGYYPMGFEADRNWTHRLETYIDNKNNLTYSDDNERSPIFQCPARTYKPANIVNTYGVHDRVFGDVILDILTDHYPRRYSWTERPAEVIMVADADQMKIWNDGETWSTIWYPLDFFLDYSASTAESTPLFGIGNNQDDNNILQAGQIRFRHMFNKRANFLFFDGHVESLTTTEVKRKHVRIND